jgi:hypothetical protein
MSCIGIHMAARPPFVPDRSSNEVIFRLPIPSETSPSCSLSHCQYGIAHPLQQPSTTAQHRTAQQLSQTRPKQRRPNQSTLLRSRPALHPSIHPSSILAVSPPPTRCPTLSLLTYSARACPLLAQRPRARSLRLRLHQTLPQAPCHAKSSGILPKLHHSLHRGLLNSLLDAASPLSQWTRKQR